jgi:hypothetical protein
VTEGQLEERLRAWYRSESSDPPASLNASIAAIPRDVLAEPRPETRLHFAFVLAAVLTLGLLAAGGAIVGGILHDSALPAPEAPTPGPGAEGRFDACAVLSSEALGRLFPGMAFTVRAGGPELAAETGPWSPAMLGSPVRSCLYDAGETRLAVHVALESTLSGEAAFLARAFLGADLADDLWPWSVERGEESAIVVSRSTVDDPGYLAAATMRLGSPAPPELADIGIELVNGLNDAMGIPDPCDLLRDVARDGTIVSRLEPEGDWDGCAEGPDGAPDTARVLVYGQYVSLDRAEELATAGLGLAGVGRLQPAGDRWTAVTDAGLHVVAVACEPFLVATLDSATPSAAALLGDRVAELTCRGTGPNPED